MQISAELWPLMQSDMKAQEWLHSYKVDNELWCIEHGNRGIGSGDEWKPRSRRD